jgi:hypothetical protein
VASSTRAFKQVKPGGLLGAIFVGLGIPHCERHELIVVEAEVDQRLRESAPADAPSVDEASHQPTGVVDDD